MVRVGKFTDVVFGPVFKNFISAVPPILLRNKGTERMANHISNINFRGRLTQLIVLLVLILCGVLWSQFAEARHKPRFEKAKYKIDKPKYRISVHNNAHKVCNILNKKRHSRQQSSFFASNRGKRSRTKALAETD